MPSSFHEVVKEVDAGTHMAPTCTMLEVAGAHDSDKYPSLAAVTLLRQDDNKS